MVGIIEETGQVNRNSGIFISKKMIAEIGFILIVAVAAVIVMETFQSPTASTGLQLKNAQQAEEAVSTSASTGPATSSLTSGGQETTTEQVATQPYPAKFNPSGNNRQDVAINSIPAMIPFTGGSVYIKDLKINGDYLYGTLGSSIDSKDEKIRFSFLGNDGYAIPGTGEYGLEFSVYSETKKQNVFREATTDAITLIKGKDLYFRVLIPDKAQTKFVHIKRFK